MARDLIIVGGGPAGLATAIDARQRGLDCLLLDQRSLPLDKACGEGLMPPGVRALEAMGVTLPADATAPFVGIRYLDGDTVAEGRFASGEGRGVRRTILIAALHARAAELGVELRYGEKVESWHQDEHGVRVRSAAGDLEARYLVAADGLRSPIRRQLGLELPASGRPRFGVRRHFAIEPWADRVEVHWADDCEAYVTPVGPRLVGVAMLYPGDGRSFDDLLASFPALGERLAGAPSASSKRGGGPFRQRVRQRTVGRVALVGDAAGYLDPITGEGVTLGFATARAAVETIAAAEGRAHLAPYEHAYRRITRAYYRMTGLLLSVAARPALRRRVVRSLAASPEIFGQMLAINSGELPMHALGLSGGARLLGGMI